MVWTASDSKHAKQLKVTATVHFTRSEATRLAMCAQTGVSWSQPAHVGTEAFTSEGTCTVTTVPCDVASDERFT